MTKQAIRMIISFGPKSLQNPVWDDGQIIHAFLFSIQQFEPIFWHSGQSRYTYVLRIVQEQNSADKPSNNTIFDLPSKYLLPPEISQY